MVTKTRPSRFLHIHHAVDYLPWVFVGNRFKVFEVEETVFDLVIFNGFFDFCDLHRVEFFQNTIISNGSLWIFGINCQLCDGIIYGRIEGKINYLELYEEWPPLSAALLVLYSRMSNTLQPSNSITGSVNYIKMILKIVKVRLEIRLDCEKTKQTKVVPYVRYRNGKKELVKGYVRKNRGL